FGSAGWPDIALRVANQIMPDEISRADTSPPVGWGVPVTYVQPKFDIHDIVTIDPGYIRIRMAHGYMAAHDACVGKRQKPAAPQTQADALSTARHTDEIIHLRTALWQMEGETVPPPSQPPSQLDLVSIRYAKRQLWTLI